MMKAIARRPRSRRNVLGGGISILAAAAVSACDLLSTDPVTSGDRQTGSDDGGLEAPKLGRLVKDGELPELPDRLPDEPMVVEPVERTGVYGGTWQTAIEGPTGWVWMYPTAGYQQLVRWTPEWTGASGTSEIIPNVAKSFEVSADGREYTFVLRRGLKWSDGMPFGASDVVFAQNDVLNNTELFPVQDPNQPEAVEVDEHTVKIVFPEPDALFLRWLCTPSGRTLTTLPAHYLSQFHTDHNSEVSSLVKEAGLESWVDLFGQKSGVADAAQYWLNPDLPTLNAWRTTNPLGDGSRVVLDRNPYFWKVDPDGRQLPYLDRIVYDVIADPEVMLTKALNGEIGMHCVMFNTLTNKPVLARGRAEGSYRFFDAIRSIANNMVITLNLTNTDPVKRELFRDKNFRIGLSHALNREEIIDLAFQGQGKPWQQAPPEESPFYDEELATQYTDHDPALAEQYLDRAGTSRSGEQGKRVGPDGSALSLLIDVPTDFDPAWLDAAELVKEQWAKVGINATVNTMSRTLHNQRFTSNEHDVTLLRGNGGLDILESPDYFPRTSGAATLWAQWYSSNGTEGEEPPASAKRQMELYDEIEQTVDPERQADLMRELLSIAKEEFWVIGTNLTIEFYGIAKERFRNVPGSMPYSWTYPTPGPTNPEQYYIES